MRHGSLFSGIGGFDLAAEWMDWENAFHCEINPFGQKVLKYYWPNAICYDDITKTDFTIWRGRIDVLTGGFPCQPFSLAGKRKGTEDERHLWPQMRRAIREIQPKWIVGENVLGIVSWDGGMVFNQVQVDLETEGYEVQPYVLPACAVNAPHRRDRVWFVAHYNGIIRGAIREYKPGEQSRHGESVSGDSGEWITTDSECNIEGQNGYSDRVSTKRRTPIQTEDEGRESEAIQHIGFNNPQANNGLVTANTNINGCDRGNGKHEIEPGERGIYALDDIEQSVSTNPNSRRQPSKEYWKTKSRWFTKKSVPGNWDNFPTQPPVCGRNDGLSTELAGITVSKHRNESIKAYGNAIVPQVVYQIFKAIDQYNAKCS